MTAGDRIDSLYVIAMGSVRMEVEHSQLKASLKKSLRYRKKRKSKPKSECSFKQGDIFGHLAYLTNRRQPYSIYADSDNVRVYELNPTYLELLFFSHPTLALKFFRYLCTVVSSLVYDLEYSFNGRTMVRKASVIVNKVSETANVTVSSSLRIKKVESRGSVNAIFS